MREFIIFKDNSERVNNKFNNQVSLILFLKKKKVKFKFQFNFNLLKKTWNMLEDSSFFIMSQLIIEMKNYLKGQKKKNLSNGLPI